MKFVLLLTSLFIPLTVAKATPSCHTKLRVAVVDSGLNLKDDRFTAHLCKTGHKNFVENESIDDYESHGTHITGLIEHYAGNANYCLVIYKYYSDKASGNQNLSRELQAFRAAIRNKADVVNFSGGGPIFSEEEYVIIRDNPKVTFVVAAGNEGQNIDRPENAYYPASLFLPNEIVVMSKNRFGERYYGSNYSVQTNAYEIGENVLSFLPNDQMGYKTGTSQATAIRTGKLLDKLSKSCYGSN